MAILTAQPFNAPGCWSRQFEDNDTECDRCIYRDSCKQQYSLARGINMNAPPAPPPGGWQHGPPQQQYYQPPPQPPQPQQQVQAPQQQLNQMFWQAPQAPYFEPHEGEKVGSRLAKNVLLTMAASAAETVGSFLRTWRWPHNPDK